MAIEQNIHKMYLVFYLHNQVNKRIFLQEQNKVVQLEMVYVPIGVYYLTKTTYHFPKISIYTQYITIRIYC